MEYFIKIFLFIFQAFPHVMHACSSIIEHKLHSIHPSPLTPLQLLTPPLSSTMNTHLLNQTEIHLFHTLHHLILYSNEDNDQHLSLNTIQLFIYLFIPYIQTYLRTHEKEFLANSDLNQGMRLIWQPIFEHSQPNIRIFNTFIKPILSSNDHQEQRFHLEKDNQHQSLSILIESPPKQTASDLTNINIEKELKSSTFIITDDSNTTTPRDSVTDLESDDIAANHPDSTKTRAPLVHMNSICSVTDLSRLITFRTIPGTSSSMSTISIPCTPQVQTTYSIDIPSLTKSYSSEDLLLATYFDIGIIRTLFSPSWLTDGYIWCLEYLQKRMINISDEILSDINISSQHFKSLSITQLNSNNQNYSKHLKKNYLNEQLTNNIIEKQYMMTTISNSIQQPTTLLNIPLRYSPRKNSDKDLPEKNADYFFIQKREKK